MLNVKWLAKTCKEFKGLINKGFLLMLLLCTHDELLNRCTSL